MDGKGQSLEISVGNMAFVGNRTSGSGQKKVSAFCPHPENMQETEIKGGGLIDLAEEISSSGRSTFRLWHGY